MKSEDVNLLNEMTRNAHMEVEAIDTILPKIYDEELNESFHLQKKTYQKLERKAREELENNGVLPKAHSMIDKARLWSELQTNTAFNINTKHVANLMIRENAKAMTALMKVEKENERADAAILEIAEELMDFEESTIEKLKAFL